MKKMPLLRGDVRYLLLDKNISREIRIERKDQIAGYQKTPSSLVYIKTERACRYQISLVIGSILVDRRPAIRNRSANPTLEYTALSFVRR